jgi:hypothetical protein
MGFTQYFYDELRREERERKEAEELARQAAQETRKINKKRRGKK